MAGARTIPGIFELPGRASASTSVQLDCTALIGLAEKGPLYQAIELSSWSAFVAIFGPPRGRQLGEAVRAYFIAGGRRAVVIRQDPPADPLGPRPNTRDALMAPRELEKIGAALDQWEAGHQFSPVWALLFPELLHPTPLLAVELWEEQRSVVEELRLRVDGGTVQPLQAEGLPGVFQELGRTADLASYQRALAALQDWLSHRRQVVLLDLPPHLDSDGLKNMLDKINEKRMVFYGPWALAPDPVDPARARVAALSSAVAGVLAGQWVRRGIAAGTANLRLPGLSGLERLPTSPDVRLWIQERVNLAMPRPEGVVLMGEFTGDRTGDLSSLAHLRLLDWLALQLLQDAAPLAFEPNNHHLWRRTELMVLQRLAALQQSGWLAGERLAEGAFVRRSTASSAEHVLAVEVGVALAVPARFIVFRLLVGPEGAGVEA